MAKDVLYLLVGIGLLAFSFLNVRHDLARNWVKRLGWLGSFPETKVARVFYGSVLSVFALVIGLAWTLNPLVSLLHNFGR